MLRHYELTMTHLSNVGRSGGLTQSALCAVPAARVGRSRHEDGPRQQLEEDDADPARHVMCARSTKVPVDYNHGDEDRHNVHDEREQQVLGIHHALSDVITNCIGAFSLLYIFLRQH